MIREFKMSDLSRVLEIWLESNLNAHPFIPEAYWRGNLEAVREMLPQAELYVYEEESGILGFIGLTGSYIAGLFVCAEKQSHGIGRQLMDFVKARKPELALDVYKRNIRAVKFYQRERFAVLSENVDKATGECEYRMVWKW